MKKDIPVYKSKLDYAWGERLRRFKYTMEKDNLFWKGVGILSLPVNMTINAGLHYLISPLALRYSEEKDGYVHLTDYPKLEKE